MLAHSDAGPREGHASGWAARPAQTGRVTGITSDAQYRFARGVDPGFVGPGLELATAVEPILRLRIAVSQNEHPGQARLSDFCLAIDWAVARAQLDGRAAAFTVFVLESLDDAIGSAQLASDIRAESRVLVTELSPRPSASSWRWIQTSARLAATDPCRRWRGPGGSTWRRLDDRPRPRGPRVRSARRRVSNREVRLARKRCRLTDCRHAGAGFTTASGARP
jgi:hypothetical protein